MPTESEGGYIFHQSICLFAGLLKKLHIDHGRNLPFTMRQGTVN